MMHIKAGCFAVTDAVSGLCVADWEIKLLPNDKEMALSYVYMGKKYESGKGAMEWGVHGRVHSGPGDEGEVGEEKL